MTGLYIHIPFCRQKCRYCDFVSFAGHEEYTDKYLDALYREAEGYRGEKVNTVFIGGGTPSNLTASQIKRLTDICFDVFDVAKEYEFTIETNPGTLDDGKIAAMLVGGVNRISVGVQSFADTELRSIGRIHDAELAYNTIWHLKNMGFSNISLDLMTALPGQTMKTLKSTLDTAVSLPVKHISAYSLIIEENTPLGRDFEQGKLTLPDEDEDRAMYEYTVDFLNRNGFEQYEISNFSKKGFECSHNIKYWTGEKYIGLGIAAHSYTGNTRYCNTSDLLCYIDGENAREIINLAPEDKMSEFIITGLRMTEGISAAKFFDSFGIDIAVKYRSELEKFISMGLMQYSNGRYALTMAGINVSNSILCEFV